MTSAARRRAYVPAVLALCAVAAAPPASTSEVPARPSLADVLFPPSHPSSPVLPGLPSFTPPPPARGEPPDEERLAPVNSFDSLQPGDRERRKLLNRTEGEWGALTSEVVFRAPEPPRDTPFERGEWSAEDTLQIPVTGPLFLFGQAVLVGEYAADQDMKVIGRTGVLFRVPVGVGTAVELRGGPTMKYLDALRLDRTREPSVLLEVQAKMPVMGSIGLEYLGEALPALTPADRPRLSQDLGLAIPVSGGKVKLGAKHRWDGLNLQQEARPWTTNMELYVGVEIGR